jgi:hypothetical protein
MNKFERGLKVLSFQNSRILNPNIVDGAYYLNAVGKFATTSNKIPDVLRQGFCAQDWIICDDP